MRDKRKGRHRWRPILAVAAVAAALLAIQLQFFELKPEVGVFLTDALGDSSTDPSGAEPELSWQPSAEAHIPPPKGTGLVADDGGALGVVLLNFRDDMVDNLAPAYDDLLAKLPLDVEVRVFCPDESSESLFDEMWGDRERDRGRSVVTFDAGRELTIWARDRQFALQDPKGEFRALIVPTLESAAEEPDLGDTRMPSLQFKEGLVDRVGKLPYHLEGGNVVGTRKAVYVGSNFLLENADLAQRPKTLVEGLEEAFGRPVFLVGQPAGSVPFKHLDMYFTPVGSEVALVADLAKGRAYWEAQAGVNAPRLERPDPKRGAQLEAIAAWFRKRGYRVERLPAIWHAAKKSLITYNNVVMDRRKGRKTVFMPIYRIPNMDEAAAAVYKSLGFEVETIDVSRVFQFGGAVRCLSNVALRRSGLQDD